MSSDILTEAVPWRSTASSSPARRRTWPRGRHARHRARDLAGQELPFTPLMMNYKTMIDKDSMYNTPPCYNIYILGLVLKWLEKQGGVGQ
jgi:phosphoserine aminotransferase